FDDENFKHACDEFCRNQAYVNESIKKFKKNKKFAQLLVAAEANCEKFKMYKTLGDLRYKQNIRLTKYPLLINAAMKKTKSGTDDSNSLKLALECIGRILESVNQKTIDQARLVQLSKLIDKDITYSRAEDDAIRDLDIRKHTLIKEGPCTWVYKTNKRSKKSVEVHVVLLGRALLILRKVKGRFVLMQYNANGDSTMLWLNTVLVHDDVKDEKAFLVVSTYKSMMVYKLLATSAEERNSWTTTIRKASEASKMEQATPTLEPCPAKFFEADRVVQELQNIHKLKKDKLRENEKQIAAIFDERLTIIGEILLIGELALTIEQDQVQAALQSHNDKTDTMRQELMSAQGELDRLWSIEQFRMKAAESPSEVEPTFGTVSARPANLVPPPRRFESPMKARRAASRRSTRKLIDTPEEDQSEYGYTGSRI
ncbi:hypothetical protein DPMN_077780, partial [Dreissena polymorpha]